MTVTVTMKPAPHAKRTPKRRSPTRNRGWLILLLAPWAIGLTVFFLYPLVATLWYSFTNFDGLSETTFVGLRNYIYLFGQDPVVAKAAYNTVWLVIALTVFRVAFALGVASVLARIKRGSGLVRTLCYLPSLVPPVAATLTFVFVMSPTGPVNTVLGWLGIEGPLWFNDPSFTKPALVLLTLWGSGEIMIIILAALLDVPKELHEAAQIDGAGPWTRFRTVTLPSISPVLIFAVVNTIVFSLQYFTQAVIAGSVASGTTYPVGSSRVIGYPADSTLTYTARLFDEGFRSYHMGYASAMAVILFAVSFAFTGILIRQLRAARNEARP